MSVKTELKSFTWICLILTMASLWLSSWWSIERPLHPVIRGFTTFFFFNLRRKIYWIFRNNLLWVRFLIFLLSVGMLGSILNALVICDRHQCSKINIQMRARILKGKRWISSEQISENNILRIEIQILTPCSKVKWISLMFSEIKLNIVSAIPASFLNPPYFPS